MKYLKTFIHLLIFITLLVNCNNDPETLQRNYDEKEMEAAIEKGRNTFNDFLTRFKTQQDGDQDYSVKVKISDDNGTEHFWLTDINLESEPYSGIISNDPGIVKCVKIGQKYSFTFKDISDWMYMNDGKMYGNYTLRVLVKSMPKKQAEAYLAILSE